MKPGDPVLLFTKSGTFHATRGRITQLTKGGAMVRVEGESVPTYFVRGEIVLEHESGPHLGGAE
jgi:hypothetical protein